jgi:hypothetical protein
LPEALGSPLTIWIGYKQEQIRFGDHAPKTFSKTPGVVRSFCDMRPAEEMIGSSAPVRFTDLSDGEAGIIGNSEM